MGYCAIGVGDIKIKMQDGVEQVRQGVRHVPRLQRNLISLGGLHGYGMFSGLNRMGRHEDHEGRWDCHDRREDGITFVTSYKDA